MIGVGALTIVFGVSTAWVITMIDFPGRKLYEWLLLLPLAIPAYLMAYIYTDFFDVTGTLQVMIRDVFDLRFDEYWFPNIRSRGGAILIMALAFYPYVYLLARASFLEQSISFLEAGRGLGYSARQTFFKVCLPLARPGIMAGTALVLMETLNDFGTVQYFGIQTFTTGIYRTWFGLGERVAAAQLSAFLLGFIFLVLLLERWSRNKANVQQESTSRFKRIHRFKPSLFQKILCNTICGIPVLFGFVFPLIILTSMFLKNVDIAINARFYGYILNTVSIALLTGACAVIIALIMAYAKRLSPTPQIRVLNRIAAIGYAIPGSVIAVGVLIPFGLIDNTIDTWLREQWNISFGLIFSGTIFAMVFAYLVRFLAVSFNAVEASLEKITPNMDEAATGMGYSFSKILGKIHMPMMSGSLFTALLLVIVDVMKELPATLIVRPFNFDTLAIQVYRLASDERLAESSGAALAIILVGLIPVLLLNRSISKSRKTDEVEQ